MVRQLAAGAGGGATGNDADVVTVGDVVAVGCVQPRKFGPVSSCSIGVTWPLIQTVSLPKAITR